MIPLVPFIKEQILVGIFPVMFQIGWLLTASFLQKKTKDLGKSRSARRPTFHVASGHWIWISILSNGPGSARIDGSCVFRFTEKPSIVQPDVWCSPFMANVWKLYCLEDGKPLCSVMLYVVPVLLSVSPSGTGSY